MIFYGLSHEIIFAFLDVRFAFLHHVVNYAKLLLYIYWHIFGQFVEKQRGSLFWPTVYCIGRQA